MGSKFIRHHSNEVQASFCTLTIIYREKNKMTVIKCIIVILALLVSRVAGIISNGEDTSSRDRIESVSQNFEKYWITSKGMNEQVENMAKQYFSDRMPKISSQVTTSRTTMLLKSKWLCWMSISITGLQMSKLLWLVQIMYFFVCHFLNKTD